MSLVELFVIAAVSVAGFFLLWWLSRPLLRALGWMCDPADTMRPDAADLRAAEEQLISRP